MDEKYFDAGEQARLIVEEHVAGYMSGGIFETENEDELYDMMVKECSFILVDKRLKGEYTPIQFNKIRNELASLIYKIAFAESEIVEKEVEED